MILFSIPVHEKPLVILDQVRNFLFFNPNSHILLHVSRNMTTQDQCELKECIKPYHQVHLNPVQLYSGWADGTLLKIHVENMRYAIRANIPFTHFCLHASNDLFVKEGLFEWIEGYFAGFDQMNTQKNNPVYQQIQHFKKDHLSQKLTASQQLQTILGSQIEGSFYHRDAVVHLVTILNNNSMGEIEGFFSLGYHKLKSARGYLFRIIESLLRNIKSATLITPFCREEVYFPTLTWRYIKQKPTRKFNYCYVNWHRNLEITQEEIDWVRDSNLSALHQAKNLYIPEKVLPEIRYFAVKRIHRDINDPLRRYINKTIEL
jgi:hypothetical protein